LFNLYYHLRHSHPVQYAAFLDFELVKVISISPELFFRKHDNQLTVKPMKGTMPRGNNATEDSANYHQLQTCAKNQAENLIIVDLLRNDLAKVAIPGSVKVEELFTVEKYASLLQMTSTISAQLKPNTSFHEIIKSLFPCGSITGAPKQKTIELIKQIEGSSRGVYTGAIGYILPNNQMQFSVAIRTLTAKPQKTASLSMGVGGGITIQSQVQQEWEEINTKLQFVRKFYHPDFKLVESLRYCSGNLHNLMLHLHRLKQSAEHLVFKCNLDQIYQTINRLTASLNPQLRYKLRIELDYQGNYHVEAVQLTQTPAQLNVMLLNHPIDTQHSLFHYKTTSPLTRGLYQQLYAKYKPENIDELIFINQDNYLTESSIYNLIIATDSGWYTPPVAHGLLPGVFRKQLLAVGKVQERGLTIEDLQTAKTIYLANDVRGLIPANFMGIVNNAVIN
jgi:para-aminobenzoate synthetase/4-amino-4-deoxychorismate lyase